MKMKQFHDYASTPRGHAARLLSSARNHAKRRGLDGMVTITLDELEQRIQAGFCEATGVPFKLGNPYLPLIRGNGRKQRPPDPMAPSLDRIDSRDQHYSPENVQVTLEFYNRSKGQAMSNEETLQLMFLCVARTHHQRMKE